MRLLLFGLPALALAASCGGGAVNVTPPAPGAMQQRATTHRTVPASSYQQLYAFRGRHDGTRAYGAPLNVNGTLYGTTWAGGGTQCSEGIYGHGCGTVFKVTQSGKEKVLYRFAGGSDGANPRATLINVDGTLYGTTEHGGTNDSGTVFSVTTTGAEKVLYRFAGGLDGANPYAGLINVNGTLYGTTDYEGKVHGCCGTVFSITTTGTENVLYRFGSGSGDGERPRASLINVNGTLYGTTSGGGNGYGTVFSITTRGTEKVLYSFGANSYDDGEYPQGLVYVKGTLYGTTFAGGANRCSCGIVFSVDTTTGTYQVLHSFAGDSDGAYPDASLINIKGMLYGTTTAGGSQCGVPGCGTIYSITKTGTETVLYSFGSGSDGVEPASNLIALNRTLFGTTWMGGRGCNHAYQPGCGTVFAFTP